jgi:tetratricopeptide (TPR) repeat protein
MPISYVVAQPEDATSVNHSIKRAEELAKQKAAQAKERSLVDKSITAKDLEQARKEVEQAKKGLAEAEKKLKTIRTSFDKGKRAYQLKKYKIAMKYFEDILAIDPLYEPAKLYLESAIIRQRIVEANHKIANIKLQMADLLAEFDNRVRHIDSLALKYFLEQAQQKCQIGDFAGADRFYNLCYKVYPYHESKIEWFVKATNDLVELFDALEEQNRKIEELAASDKG